MTKPMPPDSLVVARPHFRTVGSDLYFFNSKRIFRSLTASERSVWESVSKEPKSLGEVGDSDAALTLATAAIVDIVAPVSNADRVPVLVIEPHSDDAALSVGGTMWKRRNEMDFHLVTLASRSNYSSNFHSRREFFNRDRITEMRDREGELFVRHLGGSYTTAGLAEATLRYHDADWSLEYYDAHQVAVSASNNRRGEGAVLEEWTAWLCNFMKGREFSEIWLPLGAGTHSDHDLARNAALRAVSELQPDAVIRLYNDVPYAVDFPEHSERLLNLLRDAGMVLTPWHQEIASEFSHKLELLSIFASQFKLAAILSGVERAATVGGNPVEHFWTIDKIPTDFFFDAMWVGAPAVASVRPKLDVWRKGADEARNLTIFAINGTGRWRADLDRLSSLFPHAKLKIYAGPKVAAEFDAVRAPRVTLCRVDGSSAGWVMAALRNAAVSHKLIIAGDAVAKAQQLMKLWPIGRKLLVQEMDHLYQALGRTE